jgi:hypothetical protein
MIRAVEVLTAAGLEGSDRDTCLWAFIMRYGDYGDNGEPIGAMVTALRAATDGMTHLEQNTYLQQRFGNDAIRAAQVLIERY